MENESNEKDLSLYIDVILARFEPTDDESEATHRLSTKEVTDAINEINPGCHATAEDAFNALYEAGFVFRSPRGSSGLNLKWLMIEK